jgi:AraC-like DNA-binding protein
MTAAHETFTLNSKGYPANWPDCNPKRPDTVVSRITDQQKKDLYERNITTRDLAKLFGVREAYLSWLFPGKGPGFSKAKKMLINTRKEYRCRYAAQVIEGKISIKDAATASRIPYRSMARAVQLLKKQAQNVTTTQV